MKQFLVFITLSMATTYGYSQEVKSMKIAQLQEYIESRPHKAVVNFWATWCAPCLEEMPSFNKIVNSNEGIELIFVSLDSRRAFPAVIKETAQKMKLNATLIWLNETDANMFCPMIDQSWSGSIPATLFINNRKDSRNFVEAQLSDARLRKEIRRLAD